MTLAIGFFSTLPTEIQTNDNESEERDKIERNKPKISGNTINITSPENKTYSGPMSGYYPGTYGFENDEIGSDPDGWTLDETGGTINVVSEIGGHKKALELYDNDGGAGARVYATQTFGASQMSGTVEFWARAAQTTLSWNIKIHDGSSNVLCSLLFGIGGYIRIINSTGEVNGGNYATNTWYHFNITFDCTTDTYEVWIDGALKFDSTFSTNDDGGGATNFQFHSKSSYANYYLYVDAFSYSWDDNYNIGDNEKEGLLLSIENKTVLDWIGYSLDSQNNKTVKGNTTIPLPTNGRHNIQVFGNNTGGTMFESDMRFFIIASLNLLSPENITYTEPMSGYYPATYGFECDKDGEFPKGNWTDASSLASTATVEASQSIGSHNNVLKLDDTDAGIANIHYYPPQQTNASIEFYWRSTDVTPVNQIMFRRQGASWVFGIAMTQDKLRYYDGSWHDMGLAAIDDAWYHVRIDFEGTIGGYLGLSQWKWQATVNGTAYGPYDYANNWLPNDFYFSTQTTVAPAYTFYVDAVGYTWDDDYSIGDNTEEGLLLSFENDTILDWIGYSLDGQTNKTILGNTTIPMPTNGYHSIKVFANDSLGIIYGTNFLGFTISVSGGGAGGGTAPSVGGGGGGGGGTSTDGIDSIIIIGIVVGIAAVGSLAAGAMILRKRSVTEGAVKKPKVRTQKVKKKKVKKRKVRKKMVEGALTLCPYCQNKITVGKEFCTYCGANLKD